MKLSLPLKGIILAALSSFAALGITFATSEMFRSPPAPASGEIETLAVPPAGTPANQGYHLYMLNCAHCHGTDARGDEGPDLHDVLKSNGRIAAMIKNGVKGEMPKFGAKLNDDEVRALIAFVRSLGD
jgi:mono/diheme cytochrome c family protein